MRAKLILVGRSVLERDEWVKWLATHDEQDDVSSKIRKVRTLEKLGAEILIAKADVANEEQMQAVITQAEQRFGAIHGVIHAAGIAAINAIQETDQTECLFQFRPKVHGLFVLEKVLQGRELDFCLLLSSLSSVLGGLGFVAYSAANLFMDAFARKHNQTSPVNWISVNWDGWIKEEKQQRMSIGANLAELAITPKEGVEAFQRILSTSAVTQVVVSTAELQARIDQWIKRESLQNTRQSQKVDSSSLHARPNLQDTYFAPGNDIEQTIANIWQGLLGIEEVGIYDNFFELGSDSLLGIRLFAQIKKIFGKALPLATLFQAATVEQLASVLR